MFKLAFRYVLGYKHRSILTFILICFGALLISFFRFLSFGSHQVMIWHVVKLTTGYVQIAANGWLENKPLERALDVPDELLKSLQIEGVREISPRIYSHALMSYGESSKFVSVMAFDFEKEKRVTVLHEKMIEGEYHSQNSDEYEYTGIIGYKLAKNLGVKLGTKVYLIGSQFDGSVGAIPVVITGIFKAVETELDTTRICISLQAGRKLFAPDSMETGVRRYTSVALGVKDYREAEKVYNTLLQKFPLPKPEEGESREDSDNFSPIVHNWEDLNMGLMQFIFLDQMQGEMMVVFLILILAFGVLNNVQMSIQERIREFGTLLAIGTKPFSILKMVFYELLILMIPGLMVGMLGGVAIGCYLDKNPIVLEGESAQLYADLGFQPVFKTIVDPTELWIAVLSLLVPSVVFTLIACKRIFRLNPIEVINVQ
ncbi:MAG: ABC transporter permease [Leptospiraceae bacterium]|nr:ABC transporter permease [Leptospiraceae bacterium]MCP5493646.1 ABC transporter permease [Leptospiraceae bacterium]